VSVVSVYAVFAGAEEAERIGRQIVEERLAACVNILGPIRSIYRWQGSLETSDEIAAIFKTSEEQAGALITRIAALHSYDVPCIASWPIDQILGSYAEWVQESVSYVTKNNPAFSARKRPSRNLR
jgi:periplasmic divalent cation tolerance protein